MPKTDERCKNCEFYLDTPSGYSYEDGTSVKSGRGECRKYPKKVCVKDDYYCGDFVPRKE